MKILLIALAFGLSCFKKFGQYFRDDFRKMFFRYLLLFEQDGVRTIAEFNVHEEYEEFQKQLVEKDVPHQLINEREMEEILYHGGQYMDLRD